MESSFHSMHSSSSSSLSIRHQLPCPALVTLPRLPPLPPPPSPSKKRRRRSNKGSTSSTVVSNQGQHSTTTASTTTSTTTTTSRVVVTEQKKHHPNHPLVHINNDDKNNNTGPNSSFSSSPPSPSFELSDTISLCWYKRRIPICTSSSSTTTAEKVVPKDPTIPCPHDENHPNPTTTTTNHTDDCEYIHVWWPAVYISSMEETHWQLIRFMTCPQAVKQWTLTYMEEVLQQQQKQQKGIVYPTLAMLMNDRQVELHCCCPFLSTSSSSSSTMTTTTTSTLVHNNNNKNQNDSHVKMDHHSSLVVWKHADEMMMIVDVQNFTDCFFARANDTARILRRCCHSSSGLYMDWIQTLQRVQFMLRMDEYKTKMNQEYKKNQYENQQQEEQQKPKTTSIAATKTTNKTSMLDSEKKCSPSSHPLITVHKDNNNSRTMAYADAAVAEACQQPQPSPQNDSTAPIPPPRVSLTASVAPPPQQQPPSSPNFQTTHHDLAIALEPAAPSCSPFRQSHQGSLFPENEQELANDKEEKKNQNNNNNRRGRRRNEPSKQQPETTRDDTAMDKATLTNSQPLNGSLHARHENASVPKQPTLPPQYNAASSSTTTTKRTNNNNSSGSSNTDPLFIPELEAELEPQCSWTEAWGVLEFSGWTCRLLHGKAVFVKPGCQVSASRPGVGYFTNQDDLQTFVHDFYNWKGPSSSVDDDDDDDEVLQDQDSSEEEEDGESSNVEEDGNDDDDDDEEEETSPQMQDVHRHCVEQSTTISGLTNPTVDPSMASTTPTNPMYRTKPQDPGKPQQQQQHEYDDDESMASSIKSMNRYTLIEYLRKHNWTIKKGKGLIDWYYMKPHCKDIHTSSQGLDYFCSEEDVRAYFAEEDDDDDDPRRRRRPKDCTQKQKAGTKAANKKHNNNKTSHKTKSVNSAHAATAAAKKQKTTKTTTTTKSTKTLSNNNSQQPKQQQSTTSKGKKRRNSSDQQSLNSKKQHRGPPPHLQVHQAKSLLCKIGFQEESSKGGGWSLSVSLSTTTTKSFEMLRFDSLTGLRQFLCKHGLPEEYKQEIPKQLSPLESAQLEQWIRFANVPCTARQIQQDLLKDTTATTTTQEDDTIIRMFHGSGGMIEVFDGDCYLPGSKSIRNGRKRNKDFFSITTRRQDFRIALRSDYKVHDFVLSCSGDYNNNGGKPTTMTTTNQLRILRWAATCSAPLPTFQLNSAMLEYKEFEHIVELPFNQEEEEEQETTMEEEGDFDNEDHDDDTNNDQNQNSTFRSVNEDKEEDGTRMDATVTSTGSSSSNKTQSKRKTKTPRIAKWYDVDNRPKFSQVWPILKKLGYEKKKTGSQGKVYYTHPAFPDNMKLRSIARLRISVAFCGVPYKNSASSFSKDFDGTLVRSTRRQRGSRGRSKSGGGEEDPLSKLDEEQERRTLMQWVNFTYFPTVLTRSVKTILEQLDSAVKYDKIRKKLLALGFELESNTFYPPGSDQHMRRMAVKSNEHKQVVTKNRTDKWLELQTEANFTKAVREPGFHKLDDWKGLAEYSRSTPSIAIVALDDDDSTIVSSEQGSTVVVKKERRRRH